MPDVGLAVGCGATLLVGASIRLFVWPATNNPAHADAIVALAKDVRRQNKALALARAGYSPVVIASVDERHGVRCPPPQAGIKVFCFRPEPMTTQGEARYIQHLAAEHNWQRIIIVPGTSQATRARLLFKRCGIGQLLVVPARESLGGGLFGIVYEWGAMAKAILLRRGC